MKILLLEDDRDLLDLLAYSLKRADLEVLPAPDVPTARQVVAREQPDLAVLDVNLGQWSGLDFLRELRQHSQLPVILLTALDSEDDKVRGLELGADDYLTKPFSHRELVARIRARLRSHGAQVTPVSSPAPAADIRVGDLLLKPAEHLVTRGGVPLRLSDTEFRALRYLMLHSGEVVPTADLTRHLWGPHERGHRGHQATVRVIVHRLRQKLEVDPRAPERLQTVPRVGLLLRRAEEDHA